MKTFRFLLLFPVLLSAMFFAACNEEKNDEEKYKKVLVNHSYNNKTLDVEITNTNSENVTVELFIKYNAGTMSDNAGMQPQYISDKIKMDAGEIVLRDYQLNGDMPHGLELTYKVY